MDNPLNNLGSKFFYHVSLKMFITVGTHNTGLALIFAGIVPLLLSYIFITYLNLLFL